MHSYIITDSDVLGGYDCPYKSAIILVYILILQSLFHPLIPKEATIFVINFVVTWKPGLNDLSLHFIWLFH